ncbi:MAG: nucleoside hydrolase [Bacteroidales bacterium]|nr:nucleoside hydrolase [Bacteroidales bacterium]
MRRIFNIAFFLLFVGTMAAHPWKPAHYVIIDTDGGIDDIRAISLLLASPDVRVMGIITSGGALTAEMAYVKIKSALNSFHHEGLPVGINRGSSPAGKNMPLPAGMNYGPEEGTDPSVAEGHIALITRLLAHEPTKFSFIALGSLNTAWSAYSTVPAFSKQAKEIVWSSNSLTNPSGFNYETDRDATGNILVTGMPVRVITASGGEFYTTALTQRLKNSGSRYAAMVLNTFTSATSDHEFAFRATDEMVPLWLQFPEIFNAEGEGSGTLHRIKAGAPAEDMFMKMINGETVERNQVVRAFPTNPEFYFDDIQPYVTDIIERYGMDEWASGVLANELHRHLGVFAIIGVKMGIRAREYFATGVDEFFLTSYAGTRQPLSCMIDGILTSTGSTPGHALIEVIDSETPSPSALFRYKDMTVRITLKPEIAGKISDELKEYNFVYGLDSNIYWELVRKSAIKYWRDFSRHDIFIIEPVR